jgi:maltose alpha-D-glucosyltransferase/alpha-amylase
VGERDRRRFLLDSRWYENAIVYEVEVRSYADSNGDGIGDLTGLIGRLDYLARLGINTLWLLPFYPSPWRDDGYDIVDYYGVHPDMGSLGEFVEFVHQAEDRGIRVIIDLVLNHTSVEHPWFQLAREGHPKYRDFYVWSKEKPPDAEKGITFPGVQKSTWTYDRKARHYYFHRFYDFQPDLNILNPAVREEMQRIMAFWMELGTSGFRLDAVPFWLEPSGAAGLAPGPNFEFLRQFRQFVSWRRGDFVLLGEANVEPDQVPKYFGPGGMHMLFNFLVNQHVWVALARGEAHRIVDALDRTAGIPQTDQWANFLRNHDEIDLGRLSEGDRQQVFDAFGPTPRMQLYDRGIRRRLAQMLGGDRRRLEMAFSLLFTLPGSPVILYGDEIGMGDDLALPEREPVRTPMQWSADRNGGFSSAPRAKLWRPIISRGPFDFRKVNVADQRRDPGSLLNWMVRLLSTRRECPEIGLGSWQVIDSASDPVLAVRFEASSGVVVAVHNLSERSERVKLGLKRQEADRLVELFADEQARHVRAAARFELPPFGYRWFRVDRPGP